MAASRPRHLIMSAALVVLGLSATAFAWKVTNQLKGHPAPPIALKTIDDKSLTIPGPRGRVVLVDYWATWCGPCRESLPHLQKLADDKSLAERGLVVLAVNDRETPDKVKPFLEKNNYTFTVPMDVEGKFYEAYYIHPVPTTILIERDGKVKEVFIGYGKTSDPRIEAAIEEALKQPAPR